MRLISVLIVLWALFSSASSTFADTAALGTVEGQPLAANVTRVMQALDLLGRPLSKETAAALQGPLKERAADEIQKLIDSQVLLVVSLNPESRVKVQRGPAAAELQQGGYTPILIKVINRSTVTKRLKIVSPQGGAVYSGASLGSLTRQRQTHLNDDENKAGDRDRFLALEMFTGPPLTDQLSGLEVEYLIALIYSQESGKREATIGFDAAQGNQDLGFRGETPVLFSIKSAVQVKLNILEDDGQPTTGKLLFRDKLGHVYPPQAKRLAPDFFFQPHIYRVHGEYVLLPPGEFTVESSRGPEYEVRSQKLVVPASGDPHLHVKLKRWVNPMSHGYYCGDHHIHAAGCAHYTLPTEGVLPRDMFRQVKGEGLNVGCVLTWGPCYHFQRQFFAARPNGISEPHCLLKYDLEISGFGSQALGHVCLLNLRDQTYPGSDGTETKGWPTWPTPVMKWCKEQGGVTGYAHSASGLAIDAKSAAARMLARYDLNKDGQLSSDEASTALLVDTFRNCDADRDGFISLEELRLAHDCVAEHLPNLAMPAMNGVGAMELPVSVAEGVCDFISAMDTARIAEWNMWYHVLNCGFPLKVSGETDFPCMSSRAVGTGRVYVQLGKTDHLDYEAWCRALAAGKSYVSDGYAHPLSFTVNSVAPGEGDVVLSEAGKVRVATSVSFAPKMPLAVATGGITPAQGRRVMGDTVVLYGPRREEMLEGGERLVELVVNGLPVASKKVPADGRQHSVEFEVPIARSSWVALRQFPQFHTNPVNVIVSGRPIRVSRKSARWCREAIELLWLNREKAISAAERPAARAAYDRALARYQQIEVDAAD